MTKSYAQRSYTSGLYRHIANSDEYGMICDLSQHADALMRGEDISHLLTEDQEWKIVAYVRAMLDMSHDKISRRYAHWVEADRAHDAYIPPDATDMNEKSVITDTRSITDTVWTYMMNVMTGRNPMFQLEGLTRESRISARVMERVLHQQMTRTRGEARLGQLVLDSIKYGYAPTKIMWNSKRNSNDIVNFDPRRVFHDPRVRWGDWDRMQFIVFVDFCSYNDMQYSGLYPKLRMHPELRATTNAVSSWSAHRFSKEEGRGLSVDPTETMDASGTSDGKGFFRLGDARVVDEAWVRLAGYEIGIPQAEFIFLLVTIMDEHAVIRFQENPYGQQFPAVIGGFYPDSNKTYSQSLYDVILPLHDISTYLMRSRIDNVSAALNNLIFANPAIVNIYDLIDRNAFGIVETLDGRDPKDGVFIAEVPDVTSPFMQDIAMMGDLKQRVSAASDIQQGVPTSDGIRSATEIQRLSQLGNQRLGMLARMFSSDCLRPLVHMLIGNIQDTLDFKGSIRIDRPNEIPELGHYMNEGYLDFDVTENLSGEMEYLVIDGMRPKEPERNPEIWMNVMQILHQTGLNLEYNLAEIAEETIRSMGINDLERFRVDQQAVANGQLAPNQALALMQMQAQAGGQVQHPSVQPTEQVAREVEKGNLVPANGQAGGPDPRAGQGSGLSQVGTRPGPGRRPGGPPGLG